MQNNRPKIGIALSGASGRAIAHIAVLEKAQSVGGTATLEVSALEPEAGDEDAEGVRVVAKALSAERINTVPVASPNDPPLMVMYCPTAPLLGSIKLMCGLSTDTMSVDGSLVSPATRTLTGVFVSVPTTNRNCNSPLICIASSIHESPTPVLVSTLPRNSSSKQVLNPSPAHKMLPSNCTSGCGIKYSPVMSMLVLP